MPRRQETIAQLHQNLLQQRRGLRSALDRELAVVGEARPIIGQELVEVALVGQGDEVTLQLAENESATLEQIDVALTRIKDGTYGSCEACNAKIHIERLMLMPQTTLCVKCQSELDRNGTSIVNARIDRSLMALNDAGEDDDSDFGSVGTVAPNKLGRKNPR